MGWSCVICYEPLLMHQTICAVNCGHVFHEQCIEKWISSSKSCPQCRKKCLSREVMKLFFNQDNVDDTQQNAAELLSSLDNAQLQLSEKTQTVTKLGSKVQKLKASLKKVKDESESLRAVNTMLKARNEMTDGAIKEAESLRLENRSLRAKVSTLSKLDKVLNGTVEDVEKLFCSETDLLSMATFQVSLKRALSKSVQEKQATYRSYEVQKGQLERAYKSLAEAQHNQSVLEEEVKTKDLMILSLEKKNEGSKPQPCSCTLKKSNSPIERKRMDFIDEEDIFDTFLTGPVVANINSDSISRIPTAGAPPKSQSDSPYHHLRHGSITVGLKMGISKMHCHENKIIGVKQVSSGILKPKQSLSFRPILSGVGKRPLLQAPSYQTTKLLRKDDRFNFSLSPPHSTTYQLPTTLKKTLNTARVNGSNPAKRPDLPKGHDHRNQSIRNFMLEHGRP